MIFTVGYGFKNRADYIEELLEKDRTVAVILAAVHFEWTIKRTILALGYSATPTLRRELEEAYVLTKATDDKRNITTVKDLWDREINSNYSNAALGRIIANFPKCLADAKNTRGLVVHGNGTVSKKDAMDAVDRYLDASTKLYSFCKKQKVDLDVRLKARRKKR